MSEVPYGPVLIRVDDDHKFLAKRLDVIIVEWAVRRRKRRRGLAIAFQIRRNDIAMPGGEMRPDWVGDSARPKGDPCLH